MLLSLLVFCVQVSAGGSVRVRVWCQPNSAAGASTACTLVLQVAATGRVLSFDQLSSVFDPYTACSHDTQPNAVRNACVRCACAASNLRYVLPQGGGAGRLGLLVSRRLAEGTPRVCIACVGVSLLACVAVAYAHATACVPYVCSARRLAHRALARR
jgi:hypothetical protein